MDNFEPKVDAFAWHELLHGASIASHVFDLVLGYYAVNKLMQQEPELQLLADEISEKLGEFYQEVGRRADHLNEEN